MKMPTRVLTRTRIGLVFLGAIVLVLVGCTSTDRLGAPSQTPARTTASTAAPQVVGTLAPDDCRKATDPTEQDVRFAVGFAGNFFDPKSWARAYTPKPTRVDVTWKDTVRGALAYLEYLIYSCGYTQADEDEYFSDQTMRDVTFRDYQNLNRTASCAQNANKLKLWEFTAQISGKDYRVRYWRTLIEPTRLLTMILAFPEELKTDLDSYSQKIFPDLASCPN